MAKRDILSHLTEAQRQEREQRIREHTERVGRAESALDESDRAAGQVGRIAVREASQKRQRGAS